MIWVFEALAGAVHWPEISDMKHSKNTPMSNAVNPVMNHELYAQAERAAHEMFLSAVKHTPDRREKLMEKAARTVFRRAGTPADAADLYACAITCDIFERARNA